MNREEAIEQIGRPDLITSAFLGDYIGKGLYRTVFEYSYDTSKVVKVANRNPNANVMEWEIWNIIQHDQSNAYWFAPCEFISDDGMVLIQDRTMPFEPDDYLKIPTYFTDIKTENFGTIDGQVKCHDYSDSIIRFMLFGMPKRLVSFKRAEIRCGKVTTTTS